MTAKVSLPNAQAGGPHNVAPDIWSCVIPQSVGAKSYSLQVALIIGAEGAEMCFCLGSGQGGSKDEAIRAALKKRFADAKTRLSNLSPPALTALKTLHDGGWELRKAWRTWDGGADFADVETWLEHATKHAGSAAISKNFTPDELDSLGPSLVDQYVKLAETVYPVFEFVYGAESAVSKRVWWVNQNKGWQTERAGGYLFATRLNALDRPMVHHDSMKDVRVGDRIIHHTNGLMRAVSVATAEAVIADHPDGRSDTDGFVVYADYTDLTPQVELSAIPETVRFGAPKDGPFMVNGKAKEGYLWPVADGLAKEIARTCPAIGELLLGATVVAKTKGVMETSLDLDWLVGKTNWLKEDLKGLIAAVTGPSPQIVLAGPPGTSKTWVAKHLIRYLTKDNAARSKIIQFHPTYGYEEFIEGLRPVADHGAIKFEREDGIVLAYVDEIRKAGEAEDCFLLIDEMNRANLSRVFGELMYLFEYRDDPVDLRYTKGWKLPANLKFVGTMNTADRSIRSIDIALRRRFDVFECQPNAAILERFYGKATNEVPDLIAGFIELNQQLEATLDRHHTIGHAFFMASPMTPDRLKAIWSRKIGPLIEEYFFDRSEDAASFTLSKFWPNVGDAD